MNPNPTLREIAAKAGVSLYTVSLALRASPEISETTRERVIETARLLGYRPNPTLSALMRSIRQKSGHPRLTSVALVMPLNKPQWAGRHRYMADIAAGARARCESLGYGYEQFIVSPGEPNARHLQHVIEARGIDGLLIGPHYGPSAHLGLDFTKLTYVSIGQTLTDIPSHRIDTTTLPNIRMALANTLELGWDRPGIMLTDRNNDVIENMMLGAYLGFMHRRTPNPPAPFIYTEAMHTPENVLTWVRKARVNAVLTSRAIVCKWLRDAGLRIGQDLGFALLDCPQNSKEMAGVNQRLDEVGGSAVEVLGNCIHANARGVPAIPKIVEIEGKWKEGPSMPPRPAYPATLKRSKLKITT